MKKIFLLVAALVFSCSKTTEIKTINAVPDWFLYIDLAKNSKNEVLGTGSSTSKDEAINIALSNALSKIRVTVGSFMKNETQILNAKITEETQLRVTNEVEKFSLSGYEVTKLEFEKKSKLFYAEVKISKQKIYEEKLVEYQNEKSSIENFFESRKDSNLIQKLEFSKNLLESAESLKKNAILLYSINSDFPFQAEIKQISEYQKYRSNLIRNLKFNVKTQPDFENAIKSALTKKRLSLTQEEKGEFLIKISLREAPQTSSGKVYGMFFSKSSASLIFSDQKNDILHQKTIQFGGTSSISEQEAYKESMKELTAKITQILEDII